MWGYVHLRGAGLTHGVRRSIMVFIPYSSLSLVLSHVDASSVSISQCVRSEK
jgi:hypothetical protein